MGISNVCRKRAILIHQDSTKKNLKPRPCRLRDMPLPQIRKSLLTYQVWIFFVTFALYASVHAVRKTLGTVKNPMNGLGYSDVFVSYMNSAFMLSYAVGMVFTGTLGDRFKPTWVLLVSSLFSAAITAGFGIMGPIWSSTGMWYLYVCMWIANGIAQSCVWPAEVKLVSRWFGRNHSGSLYGIWSANGSAGNILGIGLTALCFGIWSKNATGVTWAFVLPSIVLVAIAFLTFTLPDTRPDAGLQPDPRDSPPLVADIETTPTGSSQPGEKISFWAAWCLPGVLRYSLCYACIKSINYALFYWLTPFLESAGHSSDVAYTITILNDVGWIFGGLACGFGSDWMGSRAPFVGLFIFASIVPTALIYPCISSAPATATLITLNGFLVGGAGNVVSSAVCADIGKNKKVKGSPDVTGQVVGIVDGIGALGAAITQLVIGYLSKDRMGAIFYGLTAMLGVSFLLIADLCWRETVEWNRRRRRVAAGCATEAVVTDEVKMANELEVTRLDMGEEDN